MTNLHKVQLAAPGSNPVKRFENNCKKKLLQLPNVSGHTKVLMDLYRFTGLKRTNSNNVSFQLCMTNGNEQMQIEFHNKASAMFFSVCHGFEMAAANVSRRKEEYKFQQLKKQFAGTLESELDRVAEDVLKKYKNDKQVNEMDQMFHQFIKDYLHRFIQKINDL